MQYHKECPNCSAICAPTASHCPRCRCALSIGWVRYLSPVLSTIFALLMAAFVFYYALPKIQKGRPDRTTAIANNITSMIFIGGGAAIGGLIGWSVAWVIKSANRK